MAGSKSGKGEQTSGRVASIASKALRSPSSVTNSQVKTIAATALTQAPNKSGGGKKK